ncbi:MAG: radical SAM protein [Eubacteriales bacterium]|nr:radical SAM protein [Eubacteriales bacterium]
MNYAIRHDGVNSIQITGGSTFDDRVEEKHITAYLEPLNSDVGRKNIKGEILLYITPPKNTDVIDRYFELGADRIACSLEVWDDRLAAVITPGKREFTTKQRHLDALTYISETYGPNKAFSNFIIGLEPFETLKEGATYLAERGIIPSASVWMPFGKPVMGSMKPAELDYFRRVKELFAELYLKYQLEPAG